MTGDMFSQEPYRCKLDWGPIGIERAARRGEIIVLVDTLSFSTCVAYIVSQRGIVYPCLETEDATKLAQEVDGVAAVGRLEVPEKGSYSLSPLTYDKLPEATRIILPSLNGGTCSQYAGDTTQMFAGALINASAVAEAVTRQMVDSKSAVTVIACGEREKQPEPHGDPRMAIEDYLGAGAIMAGLHFDKSPEAQVCETAFVGCRDRLETLVSESVSGRELRAEGFEADVDFAAQLDRLDVVPVLAESAFRAQD